MNQMEERPVLYYTIKELLDGFGEQVNSLWLIAPSFDRDGLEFVKSFFPSGVVQIYYGYDDSPLLRMLHVTNNLSDQDLILRVNGINFCIDIASAKNNITLAQTERYDCVRFPDDFPAIFTSDVYRVGALRQMLSDDSVDKKYHIHPKYYLSTTPLYASKISDPIMTLYSDEYLLAARDRYKSAMHATRIEVDTTKAIKAGDTIQLHYELALTYVKDFELVLDLACGSGFGTNILCSAVKKSIGVDNDPKVIDQANKAYQTSRVEFLTGDVLNLSFESESVDAVVAFEIIEHVSPKVLLKEISRVLKPGGIVCLSTPQNSLGRIPTTSDHLREFSLDEIRRLVGELFVIKEVIGIKQGSIFFAEDAVGANTFLVAIKQMVENCAQ